MRMFYFKLFFILECHCQFVFNPDYRSHLVFNPDCDSQAEAKDHGDSSRPRSASLESCEGEKIIVKMMTNDMTIKYLKAAKVKK